MQELIDRCYQQQAKAGFTEQTVMETFMLIVTEIAEAAEEYRSGHDPKEVYYNGEKPEGVPSELADTVIRIFAFCGKEKIDIQTAIMEKLDYNLTRGHKHGGKRL